MAPKEADTSLRIIDYKLNQLGVRVTPDACQLIAKSRQGWVAIGHPQNLPLRAPKTPDDVRIASDSPLWITIYQYIAAHEDTDLAEVLSQVRPFEQALRDYGSGRVVMTGEAAHLQA